MTNWIKAIQDYRSTPQYDKSLDILVDMNEIEENLHKAMDINKLKHETNIHDKTFSNILAGDDEVPVVMYNKVLKYLSKYINFINNQQNSNLINIKNNQMKKVIR